MTSGRTTGKIAESQQVVEVLSNTAAKKGQAWSPTEGEETLELLGHFNIPKDSIDRVRDEAVRVLSRCLPPNSKAGVETGLVVGYVQSGKTMSFTTVASLARDNGYRIVIVIAGTSIPLLAQSTERLVNDLRIDASNRGWQLFESRNLKKATRASNRDHLKSTLEAWKSSVSVPFPWMRRTALIMVMKHHGHLDQVSELLAGLDLKGVPALIIDDEADQASLNTAVRRQDESKTYARIKRLRQTLPHHTFLQYTATPQAPLLLNIIDSLSPRFIEVLTPGPDYVGGKDFFLAADSKLVQEIPEDELPDQEPADTIPESLLRALRLFFVGVAAGLVTNRKGKGNRSMLVHPSQERTGHSEYFTWVTGVREQWATLLQSGDQYAEDRAELLAEFETAYDDIAATCGSDMPSREHVFEMLPWAVAMTVVLEVNARAGQTPKPQWNSNYSHILVGGQAMDRGFTVEGLTVTYMPRGLGVGNADTIQQRARFFGYKRPYLGYCRVFLERASISAYRRYIEHEEDVRRRLLAHRETGEPLSSWKRTFYLDKKLKPTRASVLELDYFRGSSVAKEWFTPDKPYAGVGSNDDPVAANRSVIKTLRASLQGNLREDTGSSDRTDYQRHFVAEVKLRQIFEQCLLRLRFTDPSDAQEFTVLQILLAELLDRDETQKCTVYLMSKGLARERTVDEDGNIKNLFQGAAPSKPETEVGRIYAGDRKLASKTVPTLQIHLLNVYESAPPGSPREQATLLASEVPTVAVHLPLGIAEDLLIQPQPEQRGAGV
ncbi:MAG: Z1 domain-containing protein [Gemmatimonadaceae bacterium]